MVALFWSLSEELKICKFYMKSFDPLGTGVFKNVDRNLICGPANTKWFGLGVLRVLLTLGGEFTCSKVFAQSILQTDLSIVNLVS